MSSTNAYQEGIFQSNLVRHISRWMEAIPHPPLAVEISPGRVAGARFTHRGSLDGFSVESLPLGAIMASEKAAAPLGPGMHGTTFGGGPLTCRVAIEVLDIIRELLPHIRHVGGYFREGLSELQRRHSFIKEVRGFGLMIGLELDIPGKQFVLDGMAEGLLFNCTHDTVLRFLPPYIITEQEVDRALRVLGKLFKKV